MENDLIDLAVRVNLALAAGIAVVLLLRAPARRWFGARIAYFLWLLPALAAGACFLPPRIERLIIADQLAPVSSSFSSLASTSTIAVSSLRRATWTQYFTGFGEVAMPASTAENLADNFGKIEPAEIVTRQYWPSGQPPIADGAKKLGFAFLASDAERRIRPLLPREGVLECGEDFECVSLPLAQHRR